MCNGLLPWLHTTACASLHVLLGGTPGEARVPPVAFGRPEVHGEAVGSDRPRRPEPRSSPRSTRAARLAPSPTPPCVTRRSYGRWGTLLRSPSGREGHGGAPAGLAPSRRDRKCLIIFLAKSELSETFRRPKLTEQAF